MGKQEIINLLEKKESWMTCKEIANNEGMANKSTVSMRLKELSEQGEILRKNKLKLNRKTTYIYKYKK